MSSYDVGTRCWYPDPKIGWIAVTIKSNKQQGNKYHLELQSDNDSQQIFTVETDNLNEDNEKLPPLRNPPILEAAEDLTSLSYLNEPAVLHAIKLRYSQLNIYTYSGIVLIATNPFQRVDQLYSQDIIQAYAGKTRGELDPHLFAIAEDAYRCMKTDGQNQTIVVSGESGAGKTVSAKYIMRYFASVEEDFNNHNDENHKTDMSDVEKQILATNPIMEAFGNAKTTRNDNSSRFGKYLEILFNKNTSIIGARIRTYLLERSRLVFQPKTERNYHIFYQILSGMNEDDKLTLGLSNAEDYKYTNQGGQPIIEGMNDEEEFQITKDALNLIGINDNKQFEIYKILAALLHIGNIDIAATRNDAHLSSDEPNLVKACELLGIDSNNFAKWCIKKQIQTRSEKIISNYNHKQALVARDSFAKYIYSALFDWLVDYINQDLCPQEVNAQINSFIGVLDIYGFEHFEKNSFEQFCINYANEKLQQEFNQHVFKLEQDEYIKEQIEWSFIDFSDNQPCINLIENKLGILSLLDEESRLPSGNDESWIQKMYQTLDKEPTNKVFKKPRFGQTKFVVSHYAHEVSYDIEGFIEKNRDTVGEGHLEVLKETSNELLQSILSIIDRNATNLELSSSTSSTTINNNNNSRPKPANRKPTLGSIFKNSLIELMKTIDSTNAHYIRCIKPNEQKEAWKFDSLMVLSQLRACGVLETIRISCAGFPSRWSYVEFADRYHILVPSDDWIKVMNGGQTTQESVSDLCNKILQRNIDDKAKYQLGNSKIFFKAGMLAKFEKLRADKLFKSAVMIQKNVRRNIYRNQYLITRQSHIKLQSLIRGYIKRSQIKFELETKAAILIQTGLRGAMIRIHTKQAINSIITIQNSIRGLSTRRQINQLRTEKSAIVIQKHFRGLIARKEFNLKSKSIVIIQSAFRRKFAYEELKQLKIEAKSVNKLKEVSYKLENKVVDLTQQLTNKIQDNKSLVIEITNLKNLLQQQNLAHETLKNREVEFNEKFDSQNVNHQREIANLNKELEAIKADYSSAEQRIEELTKEQAELRQEVKRTVEELQAAQAELVKRDTIEVDLKSHIEQLKAEIIQLQRNGANGIGANGMINNPKSRNLSNKRHSSALAWNSPTSLENNARPVSVIAVSNDDDINIDDINDELFRLLRDSRQLHREIVEGLLKGLKIPPAGVAADLTRKEVLFPSRIIIIILSDMWRLGLTKESEEFLGEVLSTIQTIVSSLKDDDVIPNGAFWLSNTHELYSFVSYAQQTIIANDTLSHEMSEEEFEEYLKLVAVVKEDFESLSYNIYNMWMKKIEKELEKKAVSAVVLSQSLPGFMAPESSPFLAKVFSPGVQYKMDDILSFFNSVYWSMKSYFIEQEVMNEVIIELLKFVDALCFNDLIMRRNFLSWKRGLQLNYNVTRLEEWCKSHEIAEGSAYLSHLLQSAKLLQLRKNTPDDIDIIYEICYALKPIQIQKLISQYYVADYETPIAPNVLQAVADKVRDSHGSSELFAPTGSDGHFNDPFRTVHLRPFSRVEAYVPAWLNLPVIRRIVELVAKNASVQEANSIEHNSIPEVETALNGH
ncbi:P-loop containing nucleoside triphosphate hydrolase protein [Scheffersomyces amazonensis]|uniref:P-loop containing nucleoside triphosphate hydrolase protein n=1 Tax=Scheffersomyces amazonensis TaxID=1078765 RepID=UPI00315CC554